MYPGEAIRLVCTDTCEEHRLAFRRALGLSQRTRKYSQTKRRGWIIKSQRAVYGRRTCREQLRQDGEILCLRSLAR